MGMLGRGKMGWFHLHLSALEAIVLFHYGDLTFLEYGWTDFDMIISRDSFGTATCHGTCLLDHGTNRRLLV